MLNKFESSTIKNKGTLTKMSGTYNGIDVYFIPVSLVAQFITLAVSVNVS